MVLLDLFGEETVREDVKASTLSGQSFSEEEKERYWDFCTQSGGFFSIFLEVSSPHQITATAHGDSRYNFHKFSRISPVQVL